MSLGPQMHPWGENLEGTGNSFFGWPRPILDHEPGAKKEARESWEPRKAWMRLASPGITGDLLGRNKGSQGYPGQPNRPWVNKAQPRRSPPKGHPYPGPMGGGIFRAPGQESHQAAKEDRILGGPSSPSA